MDVAHAEAVKALQANMQHVHMVISRLPGEFEDVSSVQFVLKSGITNITLLYCDK